MYVGHNRIHMPLSDPFWQSNIAFWTSHNQHLIDF